MTWRLKLEDLKARSRLKKLKEVQDERTETKGL